MQATDSITETAYSLDKEYIPQKFSGASRWNIYYLRNFQVVGTDIYDRGENFKQRDEKSGWRWGRKN